MRKLALGLLLPGLMIGLTLTARAAGAERSFQLALVTPLQIVSADRGVAGLRINLIYGSNYSMEGMDIGLVNRTENDLTGWGLGLVNVTGEQHRGVQTALVNYTVGDVPDIQIGAVNRGGRTFGLQIGVVNQTAEMRDGIQFGLFNNATRASRGLQLGLLNFDWSSKWKVLPLVRFKKFIAQPRTARPALP